MVGDPRDGSQNFVSWIRIKEALLNFMRSCGERLIVVSLFCVEATISPTGVFRLKLYSMEKYPIDPTSERHNMHVRI